MPSEALTVVGLLVRTARDLGAQLDREFADLGLTSQQAAVLLNVYAGQSSSSELGELLSIDSAGMTRLLDRLVEKGLVAREPSETDRRVKTITLTARGGEMAPELPARYEAVAHRLESALPAADLASLRTALEAILRGHPS
jgi:DNA-binding MarR family transcriptional regulator